MMMNLGHDDLGFLLTRLWKQDRKFVAAQSGNDICTPEYKETITFE